MMMFVAVAPYTGPADARESGEWWDWNIASTSFSSWIDRLWVRPTMGWLDRVSVP